MGDPALPDAGAGPPDRGLGMLTHGAPSGLLQGRAEPRPPPRSAQPQPLGGRGRVSSHLFCLFCPEASDGEDPAPCLVFGPGA